MFWQNTTSKTKWHIFKEDALPAKMLSNLIKKKLFKNRLFKTIVLYFLLFANNTPYCYNNVIKTRRWPFSSHDIILHRQKISVNYARNISQIGFLCGLFFRQYVHNSTPVTDIKLRFSPFWWCYKPHAMQTESFNDFYLLKNCRCFVSFSYM